MFWQPHFQDIDDGSGSTMDTLSLKAFSDVNISHLGKHSIIFWHQTAAAADGVRRE